MKDGDKWTITDVGTFKVHTIDAPLTRYNENGIEIRRCRSCFSRMARIGHSPRAWRTEEQRLAMIESGDLEEKAYWCEGYQNTTRVKVKPHTWVKTETTQQFKDKRDAEMAELEAKWDAEAKAADCQRPSFFTPSPRGRHNWEEEE